MNSNEEIRRLLRLTKFKVGDIVFYKNISLNKKMNLSKDSGFKITHITVAPPGYQEPYYSGKVVGGSLAGLNIGGYEFQLEKVSHEQ